MASTLKQDFGGAEREFRLGIGELRELQGGCEAGPATILARLLAFQPQAVGMKRPLARDYELGESDPDYVADFNIYSLLRSTGNDWRVDDVRETIRLGLIGGGMTPSDASVQVARYVDAAGEWPTNVGLASAILLHALTGPQDDQPGKAQVETVTPQATTDA
jgi:Phage tail tube protein, GTA-gp10